MAGLLTMRAPETATLILSICIFAPQLVVAAIAPLVGRKAQSWAASPSQALFHCAVDPLRGVRDDRNPYAVIAAQLLDGISAATLGVLVPLIIADVMRGSGFNLAQGTVGAGGGPSGRFIQHGACRLCRRQSRQPCRVPVPCRNCRLRTRSRCRGHARDPRSAGEDASRADTRVFERLRPVCRGNQTADGIGNENRRLNVSAPRFPAARRRDGSSRGPRSPAAGKPIRPIMGPRPLCSEPDRGTTSAHAPPGRFEDILRDTTQSPCSRV